MVTAKAPNPWRELLGQLKRQGLSSAPKLAIGDGSLGFWIALQEEYGPIAQQRCLVHKTANILDRMPKSVCFLLGPFVSVDPNPEIGVVRQTKFGLRIL